MSFFRRLHKRLLRLSAPVYYITAVSLTVSLVYLAASAVVMLTQSPFTAQNCEAFLLAKYLYTAPQAMLLTAVICGAVIEDIQAQR